MSAADYNSENITASSTDATSKTVTCSGNVTASASVSPTVGVVYISEVSDEDAGGYATAYMEIYNNSSSIIDMENAYIERWEAGNTLGYTYAFGTSVTIPSNGLLIIARSSSEVDFETAWGVDFGTLNCNYDAGNTNLYFTTGRSYKLFTSGAVQLDASPVVNSGNRIVQTSVGVWSSEEASSNATPGTLDAEQALPITLTSFTATAVNGVVELAWETATETNNARFVIYRDGEAIGSVDGAGTTSEPHNYSYVDNSVVPGVTYTYVLADVDLGNNETRYDNDAVTITVANDLVEADFVVGAAYPNPFNPRTVIRLHYAVGSNTVINIYNTQGVLVDQLINGFIETGYHELTWNASGMPSGVYIVKMHAGEFVNSQKIVLMK